MWLEWVARFQSEQRNGDEKHSGSRVRTPLTPPTAHGNMKISCGFLLLSSSRSHFQPFIVGGAAIVVVVVTGCIRASIGFHGEIGSSVFIFCFCVYPVHMCERAASFFYK